MVDERKEYYRRDVEDLIVAQNSGLPLCPSDGKPCSNPDRCCHPVTYFGVLASDGVEEVAFSCPRFKEGSSEFKK